MNKLPPIRPRQTVGFGPGGPVTIDPTHVRWLEGLARAVDALNGGTASSVATPLPVAFYAPPSEATVAFASYPDEADAGLSVATYPHEHDTLPIPEPDYT